jgi:hypothetical protein
MDEKTTERKKALVVNVAILVGMAWFRFQDYPSTIIIPCGVFLLAVANIAMYLKRQRSSSS